MRLFRFQISVSKNVLYVKHGTVFLQEQKAKQQKTEERRTDGNPPPAVFCRHTEKRNHQRYGNHRTCRCQKFFPAGTGKRTLPNRIRKQRHHNNIRKGLPQRLVNI